MSCQARGIRIPCLRGHLPQSCFPHASFYPWGWGLQASAASLCPLSTLFSRGLSPQSPVCGKPNLPGPRPIRRKCPTFPSQALQALQSTLFYLEDV